MQQGTPHTPTGLIRHLSRSLVDQYLPTITMDIQPLFHVANADSNSHGPAIIVVSVNVQVLQAQVVDMSSESLLAKIENRMNAASINMSNFQLAYQLPCESRSGDVIVYRRNDFANTSISVQN